MEPERLEDRLARLDEERREADTLYNERLTAVDRALLRARDLPHPPPAYDDALIAAINQAWTILPKGAVAHAADRSLKGRLRGFIWRLVGPPLTAQQAFNAAVVDHLNRNVAAHREAERALASTIALLRSQTESMLHYQAAVMSLLQSLTLYVDTKDRAVGGQVQVLNGALSALSDDWMKHWESQQVRESRLAAQHPALLRAYDDLSQRVSLAQQTAVLLKREVERLLASPRGAGHLSGDESAASLSPVPALDSFKYVGFEDRFRGSQEKIRAQLADYVPLFAGASRVIDIGCGRGELLDLLREAGVGAHGVDVNASMVDVCRERGLSADVAGAVEYLEQEADDSLDGVIAIQVVEHLEPAYLARMLDIAFAKLKPGAPLVLETLNPACWVAFFESYIRDVTHRWPLHPETLHYLTQASGFSSVTVQFRAPVADADRLEQVPAPRAEDGREPDPVLADLVDVVNAHADKLNARLFTHMDYAIVARK